MTATVVIDRDTLQRRPGDEWLLTNGLGGFAMGSTSGIAERRYHGWLVAALTPPVGRFVALHSCAERIIIEDDLGQTESDVFTQRFRGNKLSQRGVDLLHHVSVASHVEWTYALPGGVTLTRRIILSRHSNAAIIDFKLNGLVAGQRARMLLSPLVAMRDFHDLLTPQMQQQEVHQVSRPGPDEVSIRRTGVRLHLKLEHASFHPEVGWWREFEYRRDQLRGQDCHEDLFCPGHFEVNFPRGGSVALSATVGEQPAPLESEDIIKTETSRIQAIAVTLAERCEIQTDAAEALARAADHFVVRRVSAMATPGERSAASIIAGYPWFSDWGRDTFISLEGLLLTTGRSDEALEALRGFAKLQRKGLIPNCFDNGSGEPEYNTVDGPLWFVHACCRYAETTGTKEAFEAELLPACLEVIDAYAHGTDYGIQVDPKDGLVKAGSADTQLTWMDARRDGVVFTPRFGKPIEISALWCSITSRLALLLPPTQAERKVALTAMSELARASLRVLYWIPSKGYFADCLRPRHDGSWEQVAELRPNQLFALSLPHCDIPKAMALQAIESVRAHLLTPVGLRTLAPGSVGYQPRYQGNLFERDRAYHNGTVWPWLLGPLGEATLRALGSTRAAKSLVRHMIEPLVEEVRSVRKYRLTESVGSLPEVMDADEPRRPDGCPMQAWSVAELLRLLELTRLTGQEP